jgi:hypothetical protein
VAQDSDPGFRARFLLFVSAHYLRLWPLQCFGFCPATSVLFFLLNDLSLLLNFFSCCSSRQSWLIFPLPQGLVFVFRNSVPLLGSGVGQGQFLVLPPFAAGLSADRAFCSAKGAVTYFLVSLAGKDSLPRSTFFLAASDCGQRAKDFSFPRERASSFGSAGVYEGGSFSSRAVIQFIAGETGIVFNLSNQKPWVFLVWIILLRWFFEHTCKMFSKTCERAWVVLWFDLDRRNLARDFACIDYYLSLCFHVS